MLLYLALLEAGYPEQCIQSLAEQEQGWLGFLGKLALAFGVYLKVKMIRYKRSCSTVSDCFKGPQ